jgi:predicted Zn-ribbon and HTH transcriptional regulator
MINIESAVASEAIKKVQEELYEEILLEVDNAINKAMINGNREIRISTAICKNTGYRVLDKEHLKQLKKNLKKRGYKKINEEFYEKILSFYIPLL